MLKKLSEYMDYLRSKIKDGTPLNDNELLSVRTHIEFFQHERLVHELIMVLFAVLFVAGILFFSIFPQMSIFCLDILFLSLLVPYIKHYYGLENGVQKLYELYDELESLSKNQ